MTLPAGWEGIDQNFLGLEEPWCHPDQAGVYVLPAPYEHTSSYVLGSDRGPSAIIEASQQVELYDETLKCEPIESGAGSPPFVRSILATKSISRRWKRLRRLSLPMSVPAGLLSP